MTAYKLEELLEFKYSKVLVLFGKSMKTNFNFVKLAC